MKTKELILDRSRKFFNAKGIMAVSLRNIAESLGISYGNLTYHYSSKENLLTWIYIQMMEEHQEITKAFKDEGDYLGNILRLPEITYEISEKYRFLYQDYIEIARHYPSIGEMQNQMNLAGNADLFIIFMSLKDQGLFRSDMDELAMDYLIELSNYMKSFYFMKLAIKSANSVKYKSGKKEYVLFMNKLLYPYLTVKGLKIYEKFLNG